MIENTKNLQKAYKLLALQEKISNNEAKNLIDKGLVSINNKRLKIARAELPINTKFKIQKQPKIKAIFKDENILALSKPPFLSSEEIAQKHKEWSLLHRLDKETSGILLLVKKNSKFHQKAKEEFKAQKVTKKYLAIVSGIVDEEQDLNFPLLIKKDRFAKVSVSKSGINAHTHIKPLEIQGKKTKLEVTITTGRTHQIRVHLSHIKHPIIGDTFYGGQEGSRIMLHAQKIELLGYSFIDDEPINFLF